MWASQTTKQIVSQLFPLSESKNGSLETISWRILKFPLTN